MVAVPSAIKVFNWTATMYKGSVSFDTPMLYAFGFIGLFTIGGLTGLFLATLATDVATHGTYFVVAHFHYVMVGGMVMAFMGGLHFWWPKMTGRMYPEAWAKFAALIDFHRLQSDLLPAVHSGLSRHAAALPCLSSRVPGAERAVDGGRFDSGHRLPDPDDLLHLVVEVRAEGGHRIPGARPASSGRFNPRPPLSISTRHRS